MSDFGGALKSLKEFPDYKIAVLGVPFDEKSSYLRGAAGGPAAIRKASTGKCYNEYSELGVNLAEETVLVDLGDVDVSGDADKTFAAIEKDVAGDPGQGRRPRRPRRGSFHHLSRPQGLRPQVHRPSTSSISTPTRTSTTTSTATGSRTPAPSPGSWRTGWPKAWSRSASGPRRPTTKPWR